MLFLVLYSSKSLHGKHIIISRSGVIDDFGVFPISLENLMNSHCKLSILVSDFDIDINRNSPNQIHLLNFCVTNGKW